MSKFINTDQKVVIDSLVNGLQDKLKNPYYVFTDKKGTNVDYYNQNTTKSTLDEAFQQPYNLIGDDSPLKFNLIKDAFIYGISKIEISRQISEYGLEAEPIEGEAIVLPNTFVPIPNDYFRINYLDIKEDVLFKVIAVDIDTIDNGANIYKIQYKLDRCEDTDIDKQVVNTYKMILNNVGTNFNSVIKSTDYDLIKSIDDLLVSLKNYYRTIFYSKKVQTFIFGFNNNLFYDPYMIEFLKRNKLLEGSGEYVYVEHATVVPTTFVLDYDKSFFRSVELLDTDKINDRLQSVAAAIEDDINSLMYVRTDAYFMIDYNLPEITGFTTIIHNFPMDLITNIKSNTHYSDDSENSIWNIVIDYFNNTDFSSETIDNLEHIEYRSTMNMFYSIPIIIYVLEKYINCYNLK